MTKPNDPAFPVSPADYSAKHGLTKREYFAAMAMSAVATDPTLRQSVIIECSIELADEMIRKLNSTKDAE